MSIVNMKSLPGISLRCIVVTEQPKVENPPSSSNQTGDAIDSNPVFVTPDVDFEKGKDET